MKKKTSNSLIILNSDLITKVISELGNENFTFIINLIEELHPADTADLLETLNISRTYLENKLKQYANKEFMYLRRHVNPQLVRHIFAWGIPGLHRKPEQRRYYPSGEVSAQVIGTADIDAKGVEGLELAFNRWLHGEPGKRKIIRDRLGREVEYLEETQSLKPGRDLISSLDQRLQYAAYRELKATVDQHAATSGTAVVLDVNTGEVLAMANYPSFNPNDKSRKLHKDNYRNRAVTDIFEPASAIKAFSIASVLEQGHVTATTVVDTSPGRLKVQGGMVRDPENYGMMTLPAILKRSSNVGVSRLVLDMPQGRLIDTYQRLGFGFSTQSGFPGEAAGILKDTEDRDFVLATMAFGYGVAVTPLQLARAYAILGSGGIKRPVTFVRQDDPVFGEKVMSSKVATQVVDMLAHVIDSGRSRAKVNGYHVAGKTGTARKVDAKGYTKDKHRAIFGGLVPAKSPKVAMVVTINEPKNGQYYSNQVAAPLFSKIASHYLRLFKVAPDLMETQGVYVAQASGANRS